MITCALAHEAYMQFGVRERSEANLIITRKYMRDQLRDYGDLRAIDASNFIDAALPLSFLPSRSHRAMAKYMETYAMQERMATGGMAVGSRWGIGFLTRWFTGT